MKEIKQQFMVYRNGVVADTLRKAGWPHSIIFGLNVPQLSEIARQIGPNHELGLKLWADRKVRESRLLAAWLLQPEMLDYEVAKEMALDVQTREEADIICWRLFKRLPFAAQLADELSQEPDSLKAYVGEALKRNL